MANISLSEAEKTFILHGVEEDFRCDGRSRRDYRPMELETDLVSNASGSARLRLANTDVLVGIKTEIDKPNYLTPDQGKIEFFVDCSANAAPEFEGRGGEELALELADTLTNAYESPKAFDLKFLCILPGQQCWKLFVDILILECGGNLFDAVSLAAKAALFNTKIPRVTAALMDAGEADLIISDDPYDCTRIQIENLPILVTVCKIGDSCVVDPSAEEEECSIASVVVGVSKRNGKSYMSNVHTIGEGSLHKDTMHNCVLLGLSAADDLNNELVKALNVEEQRVGSKRRNTIGFLK
ncbi:exosome complex component RRP42 [Anastrepha obliqua]|uniref:exosome complex component RRP42 n=1 Tax=Anastrepha obliqua TaxID=95512 RepID=UPI0024097A0D|nr:exosome complex component RRP42 [Anastrepha obliqua]